MAPIRARDPEVIFEIQGATLRDQGRSVLAGLGTGALNPAETASLLTGLSNLKRLIELDEMDLRLRRLEDSVQDRALRETTARAEHPPRRATVNFSRLGGLDSCASASERLKTSTPFVVCLKGIALTFDDNGCCANGSRSIRKLEEHAHAQRGTETSAAITGPSRLKNRRSWSPSSSLAMSRSSDGRTRMTLIVVGCRARARSSYSKGPSPGLGTELSDSRWAGLCSRPQ
jgi:hypothetical protein